MKKRSDGRYQKQISIEINGVKEQKCFYGKSVAEINKKILAYTGKIERGRLFSTVADEWWEEHQKTLEYNSLKNYTAGVNRSIEWFGDVPAKSVTAGQINKAILSFAKKGYSQKTVTTQLQIIRQILGHALLCGDVEYNFATAVSVPKNLPKEARLPPTSEEIEIVKNSCDAPFGLFAFFLLHTGCRRGEALAIQGKDIDFDKKEIRITKSVYFVSNDPFIKSPKTKAGFRTVPLLPQLKERLPKCKKDDYLFNSDDCLISSKKFRTLWKNYCKTVKINITSHQLRHAYATRLYELGIDEKSAQDLMGHADIMTTRNIYTHISEEKRKITAELLQCF